MPIKISSIICTHNRKDYLQKSLKSLINQSLNNDIYEIIVVDNASTDNTKNIVKEHLKSHSNLFYIHEPILGHSQSRNTGWKNAKGKYVAYLDDDAVADKDWLMNLLNVFENIVPQPGIAGGKIDPIWESDPPKWLSKRMMRLLTIIDWSDTPLVLNNTNMWLAGANIAYKKTLLSKHGGFDTNLGRKGQNLLSCDETFLNILIENSGYNIYYDPKIFVYHHIPENRLTKYWHIKRHYWNGISLAYIDIVLGNNKFLDKIFLAASNINSLLKNLFKIIFRNNGSDKLLNIICELSLSTGYLRGLF